MKSIIISSDRSGGGKTTVTLGIMRALMKKGFSVQGYKVGPDYIDPAFHTFITNRPSRNLDLYFMGEDGVKASFSRGNGDLGIVEGVMGLYDGLLIDSKYSTAHVAKTLGLPVILVISPKAQSTTLCAEINGIVNFEDINIAGIIFNNITQSYYELVNAVVNKNCSVDVLGFIPKNDKLVLKSRHLGLVQSSEIEDLNEKIDVCSELVLKYVDVDKLVRCFKKSGDFKNNDNYHMKNKRLRIAVPYDRAFSFYYTENIELLKEIGEVEFFSPLKDKKLPENTNFMYIGGGYPEVFASELSYNKDMLLSVKGKLENGLRCYAECGGLMYLTQGIQNIDGDKTFEMVGFFNGETHMTKKLQNFGYASIKVRESNNILPCSMTINCHEFHKSYVNLKENTIYDVTKRKYDNSLKVWKCGYLKRNTLASYAHVHFFGNLDMLDHLTDV
ncbi:cobyrinate a,c-diamide synthase [Clostridium fermenticellae]|uniref:Cobyrinate a,c-diamide synthase n=1 Tax=Clostridium fermenticellae TaxID=2068654 RepID=A0A386H5V7_9CLOT|nr:cobyrinate a,c-diamide synthase [Clostridium fermenticellae]AYD41036.1 cobyrinate a,c-diamide synthase [Clostridium fermenticellae]